MNATYEKFGGDAFVIKEFTNWVLLLRPDQATLGSMVLICKDDVTDFSNISSESFAEYENIMRSVEYAAKKSFDYDKINHLMLMMVDPDVHFHIVPRYAAGKVFAKENFEDTGWPVIPKLGDINEVSTETKQKIIQSIKANLN